MIYLENEIIHYKDLFLITKNTKQCEDCYFIKDCMEEEMFDLDVPFSCIPVEFPWHNPGILFHSIF